MTTQLDVMYLPALKGQVGPWTFYTTLMKFSEVVERIHMSHEIYENKNLSDMVQRAVSKSRTAEISEYLRTNEERFFPAMVVAVFDGKPRWAEFSITSSGHQAEPKIDISALDISKSEAFGFLVLSGDERMFPLDGQHRLAGIREALKFPGAREQFLHDDEVAVTLVAHESSTEGRTRSRRLFTVLNKRAVSVKKHETIALDEDDVMAISTRYLVEHFDPLTREDIVLFTTGAAIPAKNNSAFTTIVTVYDMLHHLFLPVSGRQSAQLRYHRPNSDWMDVYNRFAIGFFSRMMEFFPQIGECLSGDDPRTVISENRRLDGGHVLFRPVGQRILAQIVAQAIRRSFTEKFESGRLPAATVVERIEDAMEMAFHKFKALPTDLTERPYVNLIWDPETGKMRVSRRPLVRDVILKRYKLIRSSTERRLDDRIKSMVGPEFSVSDFLW